MVSVFLLGLLVQRFLLRPMYVGGVERRDEYATIITIALMVLFRNLAIVLGGPNQYAPADYARPHDRHAADLGQSFRGAHRHAGAVGPVLPSDQEDVGGPRAAWRRPEPRRHPDRG